MAFIIIVSFILLFLGLKIRSDVVSTDQLLDSAYLNSIRCDERVPPQYEKRLKLDDGGFELTMENNILNYSPQKKYVVSLKNVDPSKKFSEFIIVAESESHSDAGKFMRFEKTLSELSAYCPNTIIHTSPVPKIHIHVYWIAPGVDSGCISLKATVVDITGFWYSDKGKLTLQLCQGELESNVQPEILQQCDACEEAGYELIFEGIWSRQTHPKNFPDDIFSIKFSTIIGTSHSLDYRMWEIGKNATEGIAEFAETGNNRRLEEEIKIHSKMIRTVIKAHELVHPHLNEKTFALFRTDKEHHLLSIISKFTPSPDWVVGISALELCLKNRSWVNNRVINLQPIDIGTMEGYTYTAPKEKTIPRGVIKSINSSFPNFYDSPFSDENGEIKPLAKVIINRQRLYQKSCISNEVLKKAVDECSVTEWTPFSPCSNNCGKGYQTRSRKYKYVQKPSYRCNVALIDESICYGDCNSVSSNNCKVTEWSAWSQCHCGRSFRYRKYTYPASIQSCNELLKEIQSCPTLEPCDTEIGIAICAVTRWSEWSPCSTTCLDDVKTRTRLYVNADSYSQCNLELQQNETCIPNINCENLSIKVCFEPMMVGECKQYYQRWWYNPESESCEQFVYSGCQGNNNRFERYYECSKTCEIALKAACPYLPWAEWGTCSTTCGQGTQTRQRGVSNQHEVQKYKIKCNMRKEIRNCFNPVCTFK